MLTVRRLKQHSRKLGETFSCLTIRDDVTDIMVSDDPIRFKWDLLHLNRAHRVDTEYGIVWAVSKYARHDVDEALAGKAVNHFVTEEFKRYDI